MHAPIRSLALLLGLSSTTAAQDATVRISNAPTGAACKDGVEFSAAFSGDGGVIAFLSKSKELIPGDANPAADLFVHDRALGTLELASVDSNGVQANAKISEWPALSYDGQVVAFSARADNLDVDPNGRTEDVFVHDRATGATTLISVDHAGNGANGRSYLPSLDDSGDLVVFSSEASDLVFPHVTQGWHVWVRDRIAGTTRLVSADAAGNAGDGISFFGRISGDGGVVAFTTSSTNFPDSGDSGLEKVYVKDLTSGELERVDVGSTGQFSTTNSFLCDLSLDGGLVLFGSFDALVPEDSNGDYDYYLRDRVAGTTERVSVATGGIEIHPYVAVNLALSSLSRDGRFVAFTSDAPDVVAGHDSGQQDVFVHDRLSGVTSLASVGTLDEKGQEHSYLGDLSGDGSVVAFLSGATEFAADDANFALDAFIRVRSLSPATAVHYGSGFPGRNGAIPSITPDVNPWRGSPITLTIVGSSASYTIALLFLGGPRASIPTDLGGTLLLTPVAAMPLALSPYGGQLTSDVPGDWWANGLVVDLQLLELDPWAANGVSFSDGLELTIGDG